MTFLWGILIGVAFGFIASMFSHRRDPGSTITRMIIGAIGGIIGALVALWVARSSTTAAIVAALGAILFLSIYWFTVGNKKAP